MKAGVELTASHAADFRLEAQREGEHDSDFRTRIAGALRDMGHLIEAHEAQQNARYDDPESGGDVLAGIFGAASLALGGRDFGSRGYSRVGDEIAAGIIAQHRISPEGQRQRAADEMLARMLVGGLSPDDAKKLLG